MVPLNNYVKKPASGIKNPRQVVLLLHGYGSNGQDLISLAPYWQASVPDALFVSPDAPFPCELGMGYQWFSLGRTLEDAGTPVKDYADFLEGAQEAHKILNAYIDTLLQNYGLKDENLALVGFSQGTMMSLYTGLRREAQIAGVLGYSGALIGMDSLLDVPKPPVRLIHGENDSVVPVRDYHNAVKLLTEKGYSVSGHTTARLEHSIDAQGVESGAAFLEEIFN